MRNINIDKGWKFGRGHYDLVQMMRPDKKEKIVDLPHDYMIESEVREDAVPGPASGYYTEGVAYYIKMLEIPAEWENEKVFLHFDGVMMNATVELNGYKVALQHYGYVPFVVDLTPYVCFGGANRLLVTVNPSMQPNSRWYSGAGIFRSVELIHTPKVYLKSDGIFAYTDHIEFAPDGTPEYAVIKAQIDIANETLENRIVKVDVSLAEEKSGKVVLTRSTKIQINPGKEETAQMSMILEHPLLWDDKTPNLYKITAAVSNFGVFRTHMTEDTEILTDENSALFGVHTITADAVNGLRVNGRVVKLKGGCLHHDNGLLGAVSVFDAEYRKLSLLKAVGFNAVRTTHNPPSPALIEACDRLGIYVFDEAFDCWGMGKQPGDYNMFFDSDWKKDLTAFVKRDRVHPSIVIWSTGNEIVERGGLGNGYTLATQLADTVRALDPSRPVSNGICSFWNGLDDELQMEGLKAFVALKEGDTSVQNADIEGGGDHSWESLTECFTNGLDIVGYNYMENKYPRSHELFPDRVILGSENYGKQIGIQWPMVESTPYVIGDFTWTAFDYIGEAGIGKAIFFDKDDPTLKAGPFALSSHTSTFPWRTANDADYDITGVLMPQGAYRSVVFGSDATHLYSYDPDTFDKAELISMWGFTGVEKNWSWSGKEGQKVKVAVFSGAEEVELLLNGESLGVLKAGESLVAHDPELPKSFLFETVYTPGELVAVSRTGGIEISRDVLTTAGTAAAIRLVPEKTEAPADGHSLLYVRAEIVDENGNVVPDAQVALKAAVEGAAGLIGFGSGNPVTAQNYTSGCFDSYKGRALAILRAGYESGEAVLSVSADGFETQTLAVKISERINYGKDI